MKKTVCFVLLAAALFTLAPSAFADGFTLHNGIRLGMTRDEVIRTELDSNFGLADGRYGEGKIAGFDGAVRCEYGGPGAVLDKVCYFYYTTTASQYSTLGKALSGKYGAPSHTSASGTYYAVGNEMEIRGLIGLADAYSKLPLTGQSINDVGIIYERPGNWRDSWFVTSCRTYEQWLIPQEDEGAVLIDHSIVVQQSGLWDRDKQKVDGTGSVDTYELIIYSMLTPAEAETLRQSTQNIYSDL